MITVTSAEKKKIEEQIKTALPFVNGQIDFEIRIENEKPTRSLIVFEKAEESFSLPIFYLTPSTDEQAWTTLENEINRNLSYPGFFFVKFEGANHLINEAKTFALTKEDLIRGGFVQQNGRVAFNENSKIGRFALQLFEQDQVKHFFDQLINQSVDESMFTDQTAGSDNCDEISKPNEVEKIKRVVKEVKPVIKPEVKSEVKQEPTTNSSKSSVYIDPEIQKSVNNDKKLDADIKALISDCFGIF